MPDDQLFWYADCICMPCTHLVLATQAHQLRFYCENQYDTFHIGWCAPVLVDVKVNFVTSPSSFWTVVRGLSPGQRTLGRDIISVGSPSSQLKDVH